MLVPWWPTCEPTTLTRTAGCQTHPSLLLRAFWQPQSTKAASTHVGAAGETLVMRIMLSVLLCRCWTPAPGPASSSLQCYDMAAGRWDTSCAPMSVARYSHGVAALHGEVWALGGGGRNGVCSTNLRGGVQPMAQQLAAWCGTATQLGEWCLHGGPVLRGVL